MQLPSALTGAIREQRVVLFLGAGASADAQHPEGVRMPLGDDLRDLLCDKFLDGDLKHKPLSAVAAMAATEVGLPTFQRHIYEIFEPFRPAQYQLLIPQFRWRAIATTNFDLVTERAYGASQSSLQNLVKTVSNGDGFDVRLQNTVDPLLFYKLHGCISEYTNTDTPLILGDEQYAEYEKNRTRFYARFGTLALNIRFCSSGIQYLTGTSRKSYSISRTPK